MKSFILKLALALCVQATASAILVDFSFRYDRVELRNGRVLEGVTFKTYDTQTGKVGAVTKKEALTVRVTDLPDNIATKIRERVPVQTDEDVKAEKQRAAANLADAKRRAREQEKRLMAEDKKDRDARRKLDVKRAEVAINKESRVERDIASAAKEMATHYFTYEADPHSNIGYVFDTSVRLDDPEPVPGWSNRWRVRGKVGVQYLSNTGSMVRRGSKDFELLIDAPASGKPKLVDITVSRI
jgi:hypothetical protein